MSHFANEGKLLEDITMFLPSLYFLNGFSMLCLEQRINKNLLNWKPCSKCLCLSCMEFEMWKRQLKIWVLRWKQRLRYRLGPGVVDIKMALSRRGRCSPLRKSRQDRAGYSWELEPCVVVERTGFALRQYFSSLCTPHFWPLGKKEAAGDLQPCRSASWGSPPFSGTNQGTETREGYPVFSPMLAREEER